MMGIITIRGQILFLLLAAAGISLATGHAAQLFLYAPCSANGATADISAYAINSTSGSLTSVPGSPFVAGQFLESATVDPMGRFIYVANGNAGNVFGFAIDPESGALTPVTGSPFTAGADAFSVAVDPTGRFVYVTGFNSSNIAVYSLQPGTGTLTPIPGSPFAAVYRPVSVTLEPSGRFAYVTTDSGSFEAGSIAAYAVDPVTGALTAIPGSSPSFATNAYISWTAVHPTGRFIYVTSDVQVFAYKIDPATGNLTDVPGSPYLTQIEPVALTVDPTGRFLYIANSNLAVISAYAIDSTSGGLTTVPGSPFTTGNELQGDWAQSVTVDPTGRYVYASDIQSNFWGYAIDSASGALTAMSGFPLASSASGPAYLVTTSANRRGLGIAMSHIGNFTQGQNGVTYSVSVSNAGAAATTAVVTLTEEPPAGLALVAMDGTGWTCPADGVICTRSDSLAAGASYPPLTVTMNVATNAPSSLSNSATVFDVGSATAIASDPTTILLPPSLSIGSSHIGSFSQGQTTAAYWLLVSNSAASQPTFGTVTANDTLPAELFATAIGGTGWNCTLNTLTCTRADPLAAGASYPPIQVLLNVDNSAPAAVTNNASVSGGGSATASASDPTTIASYASVRACDVGQYGGMNIADVQEIINEALGVGPAVNDLNDDGVSSIVDVQTVINAAVGLGCFGS